MAFQHILLTTDLSDDAERAFAVARQLALAEGGKITLLHIVEAARAIPHGAPFAAPLPMPGIESLVEDATRMVEAAAARITDVNIETAVIVAGEVAKAIDAEATARGCDLIALSTHGRSGLRRLVLGSVAEAVIRHAHVPVLSIPPV